MQDDFREPKEQPVKEEITKLESYLKEKETKYDEKCQAMVTLQTELQEDKKEIGRIKKKLADIQKILNG
jgi:septal ring factor EnvC (AmiA/AmiB activator)